MWLRWLYMLSAVNYLLRYVRWEFYLKKMGIPLTRGDRFALFFTGLALSVTPAKVGELMKAEFIRNRTGAPLSKGIPLVMMERLTDFISLIFLCFVTIFHMHAGRVTLLSLTAILVLAILILSRPTLVTKGIGFLRKLPRAKPAVRFLEDAYGDARVLLAPGPLLTATVLGCAAWFAECLGCLVVFHGLAMPLDVGASTFIYSFSTIFGALSLLPGGIGTTEASMTGLLVLRNFPLPTAAAATLVVRACTLWFAVLIGGLTAVFSRNRFQSISPLKSDPGEHAEASER